MTNAEVLDKVKKALGGNRGVAQALSVTPQAVSQWKRIPQDRVAKVSELTGIPAHTLRPDLSKLARAFAA